MELKQAWAGLIFPHPSKCCLIFAVDVLGKPMGPCSTHLPHYVAFTMYLIQKLTNTLKKGKKLIFVVSFVRYSDGIRVSHRQTYDLLLEPSL